MLLAVGIIIVFVSCIGGFAVAGGNPVTLIHAGEIMIICGIGLGILVVSSPKSVLLNLKDDIVKAFKGGIANEGKFVDLLVLMYELFMLHMGVDLAFWFSFLKMRFMIANPTKKAAIHVKL